MSTGKQVPQEETQKAGEIEDAGVAKRGTCMTCMTFVSSTGNADLVVVLLAAFSFITEGRPIRGTYC